MNTEPPDYSRSLPPQVRATGDASRYFVASASRPDLEHLVDVQALQCSCESAEKGVSRQAAIANGGAPPYAAMCEHLKVAIIFEHLCARHFMPRLSTSASPRLRDSAVKLHE
jgi:hypothetical protein